MRDTALILIDLQNDYFPGGAWELEGIEEASRNAAMLLQRFRSSGLPVVHVQHLATRKNASFFIPGTPGVALHASVAPNETEPIVIKHHINAFLNTTLLECLGKNRVKKLILVGGMSHMCVQGAARAACDLGFDCVVIHDACATREVSFNGLTVSAAQVHASAMAALGFAYATILSTEQFLKDFK